MAVEVFLGNPPENIRTWIEQHSQPPVAPSPYFTYDSNRVITGLYQGSPNIQEEGGWTYGGSNVVENYATAIGDNAFNDIDRASYGIPPSKGIIGNITFQNVTSIGDSAFSYCGSLMSMTIPDSATSIGEYAFVNCDGLQSATIGNGVTSIGQNAFSTCSNLTSVTIGSGIQRIGQHAFETYGDPITLTIGKTVAEVEAMGQNSQEYESNAPYSDWYLPSGSTIVCTNGTITI